MIFLHPERLWVLLIPLIYFVIARQGLSSINRVRGLVNLSTAPGRRTVLSLRLFCLTLICISLLQPVYGYRESERVVKGKSIVFMVDVSLSMLAEDLRPNRLEMTRLALLDLIPSLKGDKTALVLFSGEALLTCPLTTDYAFFRQQVKAMAAGELSRGGTLIGDALRYVMSTVLSGEENTAVDIYLFTDGEDHESYPLQAASALNDRNIRLITVGMGTPGEGQPIPVTDSKTKKTRALTYEGKEVHSSLDEDTLKKMAASVKGGRYLGVSGGNLDLVSVYRTLSAEDDDSRHTLKTREYREIDPWLWSFALAALFIALWREKK